jgi:hypothetical protein
MAFESGFKTTKAPYEKAKSSLHCYTLRGECIVKGTHSQVQPKICFLLSHELDFGERGQQQSMDGRKSVITSDYTALYLGQKLKPFHRLGLFECSAIVRGTWPLYLEQKKQAKGINNSKRNPRIKTLTVQIRSVVSALEITFARSYPFDSNTISGSNHVIEENHARSFGFLYLVKVSN